MANKQRKAFVVMPFGRDFDMVYNDLIRPAFESAGYQIARADNITNQRNILHDIVVGIQDSDVVVADLTEANPNVYYELGLAHGMERNVILISQDPSDAPFDLRSYRIFEYHTRYDRFVEAKARLDELAREVAAGKIGFGNPVSDYRPAKHMRMPSASEEIATPETGRQKSDSDRQPGLLDSGVAIEEGFKKANKITARIGAHIIGLGSDIDARAPVLNAVSSAGNIRGARNLLRTMSRSHRARTKDLHALNADLVRIWDEIRIALERVVVHPGVPSNQRQEIVSMVQTLAVRAKTGKESVFGLVEKMNSLPPLETMFDKTKEQLMDELLVFAATIEEVESVEGRFLNISTTSSSQDAVVT